MEAPEAALVPGSTLDRYELLCPLAQGGMATVWLARMHGKRGFEKVVAIKTIKAELVDDPRFEEMFLDEARIASGITHPNVAQIIDLGERSGVLYLVMEWVDGESLAKVRKFAAKASLRVPLGLSLRIVADACAGLHAAHELKDSDGQPLGVVHRDVSPQNILISTAGAVKVIDFGVAKAQNRLGTRTRTGVVKGKVQYMAPEQAKGNPHDRRVDIWALGVCLYELFADRLPFDGDNPLEVLSHISSDDPPPLPSDIPAPARNVVAKALARNPAERFLTAAAMRRAIENALTQLDEPCSGEDVAAFIEAHMPERATQRQEIVTRALKAADARTTGNVDAFTGTVEVTSGRTASTRVENTPRPVPDSVPSQRVAARAPGSLPRINARAMVAEDHPSRTGRWVALLIAIVTGVAGYLTWRSDPARYRAMVARYVPALAAPEPSATAAPAESTEVPAPSAAASIEIDAPALASASSSAVPTPSASAAPSVGVTGGRPWRRHTWPPVAGSASSAPRPNDWLPKESQLPVVQPGPQAPAPTDTNPYPRDVP